MNLTRRNLLVSGAFAGAATLLPGRAWADAPALVRGVSVSDAGQSARIVVGLDRQVAARTFFLSGPDRFVIDIANARWDVAQSGQGAGVVQRYRCGQRPDGSARLVLDLLAPASLTRQTVSGHARSPELSFDLAASAPIRAAAPAVIERPGRANGRRIIVLDPGHGGHDPGAIGATGVREKDVVLDAALKLRDALESRGNYRVELTRDADRFIPLPDRVAFARQQNADLFVSLHADSHTNPEASGASIYTLSERGANRAQSMMGAQNWNLDLGAAPRNGMVGDILVDLAQRETTNRSAQFAEAAIQSLHAAGPVLDNSHRSAGFFVLLAPDVPAVLIETGFLSNIADERRLASPRAREAIASALAGAVDGFFAAPTVYAGA